MNQFYLHSTYKEAPVPWKNGEKFGYVQRDLEVLDEKYKLSPFTPIFENLAQLLLGIIWI